MSHLDTLTNRLRNSLSFSDHTNGTNNKPDFRELDPGSPVSTLRNSAPSGLTSHTTSSSSTSSSGSASGHHRSGPHPATHHKRSNSSPTQNHHHNHSGELSGSVDSSPTSHSHGRCSKRPPPPSSSSDSVNSPSPVAGGVLPAGNICPSGKILKPAMARPGSKTDVHVLGSGAVNYGHGSIMRGGGGGASATAAKSGGENCSRNGVVVDPEELKRMGNEQYKDGRYSEALGFYERAITIAPSNATYRFNKAVALTALKRLSEAVREYEEALRLDSGYTKAHHRLGSLLVRLGQGENARRHVCYQGQGYQPDANELQKLQALETHLRKCTDARKIGDWRSALREVDAAVAAGADASPQLHACRTEALLKLHQLEEANFSLSKIPKFEPLSQSCSHTKIFGMLSEAYVFFVRAQIEMAFGRFENAVTAIEKAGQIDPRSVEVSVLINNVRLVSRARARGNDLFKSERFTEACSAYGEGLKHDPSNSVLYCNRAACWFKLGLWEHSIDDCNQALRIQPNYTKALLRRAASNSKLERWAEAVRDYEVLSRELPHDNEVAESLFQAQVAMKKSRGEDVHNLKFGGEVESVSGLEQFRAAISSPGASVVHFKAVSNVQCKQISPFLDTLCGRFPSINFLKVDVEESPAVAIAENVRILPTFKIYKNGSRVKEMICPSPEVLESSVRRYSF